MNEITATGKYLLNLWKVYREHGFEVAAKYELATTLFSCVARVDNMAEKAHDKKEFRQTSAEKYFKRFKAGDFSFRYRGNQREYWEDYGRLLDDRKARLKEIRLRARERKNERLDEICDMDNYRAQNLIYWL